MIQQRPSPNHGPRATDLIDMMVIHYTGMESAQAALDRLCDPQHQVSAHYLIDEDGTVYGLVPEERRAWHAGKSFWRGETDINSRSIGIELVNPGHEFGYRPFTADQTAALIDLAQGLINRHPIPPRHVVGHADIAPVRKLDPGELFPWAALAEAGVGVWPRNSPPDQLDPMECLMRWGYDLSDPGAAIAAFQRHFRPSRIDGILDSETAAQACRLITQFA